MDKPDTEEQINFLMDKPLTVYKTAEILIDEEATYSVQMSEEIK